MADHIDYYNAPLCKLFNYCQRKSGMVLFACIQVAAEKLDKDAVQCDVKTPGAIVETAKKIASMWAKMAQLLRSGFTVIADTEMSQLLLYVILGRSVYSKRRNLRRILWT